MAAENKQLKNEFLGAEMTSRSFISNESKNFAASMLRTDELDNAKETFKSSYSETNFSRSNGRMESRYSEAYTITSNGVTKRIEITKENGEQLTSPMKSFIQQRVERLYGPGALAQGFFNQKRPKEVLKEKSLNQMSNTPKFYEDVCESSHNGDDHVSLPVMRHLRPEFRAQLPLLSPKRSPVKPEKSKSPERINIPKTEKNNSDGSSSVQCVLNCVPVISETVNGDSTKVEVKRDAHYFLDLEKKETDRLIELAVSAEKHLELIQNQDVSEEVLGFLRSAAGKARLLATQKMQQFEGLCYNNINGSADEPFPTTLEDLQGFWDMVCLQVRNVDALFAQIKDLKANGWQEIAAPFKKASNTTTLVNRNTSKPSRGSAPAVKNEKARLAAEKREADRKAMLELRRKVARERQLAARSGGTNQEDQAGMGIEGSQEVEIFVGRTIPSTSAPKGDCFTESQNSFVDRS